MTLTDGRQVQAELLGSDAETDIAVLKMAAAGLRAIRFGESATPEVRGYVVSIGNPFGLGQSVTAGVVSALRRSGLGIEAYEDFIQTDASINPGNSGGALFNLRGELVGIDTAILGQSGNIGIGFAIPIDMARAVAEQILAHGEVRGGRLGVLVQDVTPDLRERLGLSSTAGALISMVEAGPPAERAGLRAGDVIVAVGGVAVRNSTNLRNRLGLIRAGRRVSLDVVRKGARRQVETVLSAIDEGG